MSTYAGPMDDLIVGRMREGNIAGLSLAIIQNGRIIQAKGYGFTDKTDRTPVTPDTLFQAGSVSKCLAALGALHLIEKERLSLHDDVNSQLRTWQLPENDFTKDRKVTLHDILCHNAGLTVHGFPGYAAGAPIPTLVEVLDGVKPANTAPVRVDLVPGTKARYSGGGYMVLQQWMLEVTGQPFPVWMREKVLQPLGMLSSSFEPPLSSEPTSLGTTSTVATGHAASGKALATRWHIFPEMAAAGLWTTASDLARFAIGLQEALAGRSNHLISPAMTRQMLTRHAGNHGLGVFLDGEANALRFYHTGRNPGFDALLLASAGEGKGVAILLNTNADPDFTKEIVKIVAREYWSQPNQTKHQ